MEPSENTQDLTGALRDDAQKLQRAASDRLQAEAEVQKGEASQQVKNLSSALGTAAEHLNAGGSEWMKSALQQGAQALERLSRSVEQQDSSQLLQNVQRIARENPATFLAGCAALGFAAARVMRAGTDYDGSSSEQARGPTTGADAASDGHRPAVPLQTEDQHGSGYRAQGSSI